MKIVAVLGSPRPQGNSAGLARQFLAAARELGAEVQEYQLNKLNFQGCQGCRTCKTKSEACILEDDLAPVLAAIKAADLLVLASPVYFGDLIGQMKCFFDRTYSYLQPRFQQPGAGGETGGAGAGPGQPGPGPVRRHLPALRALAETLRLRAGPPAAGRRRPGSGRPRPSRPTSWPRPPPWPGSWCRLPKKKPASVKGRAWCQEINGSAGFQPVDHRPEACATKV